MTTPSLHLIANARSGRGQADRVVDAAGAACAAAGVVLHLHPVHSPHELPVAARRALGAALADGGTVVVSGGDGSVRSVASVIAGTGVSLAVIPSGTFNFFAREHGVPAELDDALAVALHGSLREVAAGLVNDELFVVNASIGLYAKAIRERERSTRRFGRRRLVVILSTLATLLGRHAGLDLVIERAGVLARAHTPTVFVGTNELQLRELALPVCSCVGDGRLAVLVLRPVNWLGALKLVLLTLLRRLSDADRLAAFCADTLTVHRGKASCTVALDGELLQLRCPLQFKAFPAALRLCVPDAPEAL